MFTDINELIMHFLSSSIDKVPKVTSPVLVIHGTEDEVIDFSHGMTIYEKCPRAVEPLWVEGAGHNDVEMYSQYLERLKQFVSVELVNWQKLNKRTSGNSSGKRTKGDGDGRKVAENDDDDNEEDEEEDLNTGMSLLMIVSGVLLNVLYRYSFFIDP